jgi:excisionase family DNA binding protein
VSQTQPTSRRYATLAEAAAYLECNERTLRRLVARGQLTGYRIGSKIIRLDLNEVDDFLARPIPTGRNGGDAA